MKVLAPQQLLSVWYSLCLAASAVRISCALGRTEPMVRTFGKRERLQPQGPNRYELKAVLGMVMNRKMEDLVGTNVSLLS